MTSIDWSGVQAAVDAATANGGSIGVTLIAPDGERFVVNGDRRYRAASTVKIPLMLEIFKQVDAGQRSLTDPHVLRAADRAPGSGVILHLHEGIELTLNDLIYLMMSISDNTATNILIDHAGMSAVNATMRSLGMTGSTLGRKMKGRPAQGDEQENWATPGDYARLMAKLLAGEAASATATAAMIDMLEKQQNTRRISRHLPEREGIRWGSKTGSVTGVTNDVGFITTDQGTLILSIFCEDLADHHLGEAAIGEISRAAMRATGIVAPLTTS